MMINFNNTKLNNINFCGKKDNVTDSIADIQQLPCAKCGSLMLSPQETSQYAFAIRCKGPDIFEAKKMQKYKDSKVFKVLQALAKLNPNASIRKTLQPAILKNNTSSEYLSILQDAKLIAKPSKVTIEIFKTLKPRLKAPKQNLIDVMEVLSEKYSDYTFEDIFQMPEFIEKYKNQYDRENNIQKTICDEIFDDINEIASVLPEEKRKELNNLNQSAYKCSIGLIDDDLKKFEIKNIYREFIRNIENSEARNKIVTLINNIPIVKTSINRVLGKLSGKSDEQILIYLLSNLHSQKFKITKNADTINNTLRVCDSCNNELEHMTFKEAVARYDDFANNIQKQIDVIIANIIEGKLNDFKNYPFEIKRLIEQKTKGKIKINTDNLEKVLKDKNQCVGVIRNIDEDAFMRKSDTVTSLTVQMKFIHEKLVELKENPQANANLILAYKHLYSLCKLKQAQLKEKLSHIPNAYY